MTAKDLILPFKRWKTYAVSIVFFSVVFNFNFWEKGFDDPIYFLKTMFWSGSIWLTQWMGNVYVGTKIGDKYSWLEHPYKRFIYGILGIVVYSGFAFVVVQFIMHLIFYGSIPDNEITWVANQLKITIPMSIVISFAFNSTGFFKNWKDSEINAQRLETEMLRYKYESLQNQINPHFLFNSFNVLMELIPENKGLAVEFVQKMSGLYRYVLESKEKELVPLSEELAFIKRYIFLLETRFEKKVIFNVNINHSNEKFIVPMALQLLIENAVKHNIATSSKVLTIDVFDNENSIVVKNNLQLKNTMESSTKTGLKNLQQQYQFFTEKEIKIEEKNDFFEVEIPLLNSIKKTI